MYDHFETHELTPPEQKRFGLSHVSILQDGETLNGVVLNVPDNGLLAGDRVRSSTNPDFDPNEPRSVGNRPYTFAFTDDYNADHGVRLAEAGRVHERTRVQQNVGELTVLRDQLDQMDDATRVRAQRSLQRILEDDARVRDPDKKLAVEDMDRTLGLLENSKGKNVPRIAQSKLDWIAGKYASRGMRLDKQGETNRQRQDGLQRESQSDWQARASLTRLGEQFASVSQNEEDFLKYALKRATKPGVLTVNNAWFHREEPESWQDMLRAQDGFELLYGPLMRPMSKLAKATIKAMTAEPDAHIAYFADQLVVLEDVVDLARVGGDYDILADRLQEVVFEAEDLILSKKFSEARKAAKKYRLLLRYRTLPGSPPPEAWYGGLPGVKTGPDPVVLSPEVEKDPFHGLSQVDAF